MPLTDFPSALRIKDPIHGYVSLSEVEKDLLDLKITQRLRYIKGPAGLSYVYPGADISLMGRTLGFLHMTKIFLEYLGGTIEEIQRARLASLVLMIVNGPWANVMDEYLTVRGASRLKLAEAVLKQTIIGEITDKHGYSKNDVIDTLEKGVPIKGVRLDLINCPINPELIDNLERDSYFAGVDYAQLEFHRLFDSTRIAKNKIAVERSK